MCSQLNPNKRKPPNTSANRLLFSLAIRTTIDVFRGLFDMRYFVVSVIILLSANCPTANAGPNSVTRFLMNDPPSMLDLGILRMERFLRYVNKSLDPVVDYNFSSNKIIIYAWSMRRSGRYACRNDIVKIRQNLVPFRYGSPYPKTFKGQKEQFAWIVHFFLHYGYTNGPVAKKMDHKLYYDLPSIIEIRAFSLARSKHKRIKPMIQCSESLASNHISFTTSYK